MPRTLLLGNGNLLATYDQHLQMRDVYYPYVGMEDHTSFGKKHRVGIYIEGKGLRWFDDPSWKINPGYVRDTLVGDSRLVNDELGVIVQAQDYVHPVHNILVRHFEITSTDPNNKIAKLFFHHDFYIYGDKQKDTAFYEPYTNSVIHYRGKRYFLIGGETSHPTDCKTGSLPEEYQSILYGEKLVRRCGISSYSVGKTNYQDKEGTWKDAEDGYLANTTIDQGSVDSTVCIECTLDTHEPSTVTNWVCFGKSLDEVVDVQETYYKHQEHRLRRNCNNYWKNWCHKEHLSMETLATPLRDLYRRSLLIMRLHCDNHGGMLAACDADIMNFNRDTYTYVWPRDGAFVSLAFDKAGYQEVTRRFFEFCCRVQTDAGYMLHKYNPDGSLGSSWHPWYRDHEAQLPIQEDETALVIHAMWKHFEQIQDFEFIQQMYEGFVKDAAQFLLRFREKGTGLPLASYDPWEEHRGVFTYTTATVVAGLKAAAQICELLGHYAHSERYQKAADETLQSLIFTLFDEQLGRFVKKVDRRDEQTTQRDETPDISICVLWKLGVLPASDLRIESTMNQLMEQLKVQTDVGGFARYTNDYYHATCDRSKDIPGNPWILTTLWIAQWHIMNAKEQSDLDEVLTILHWVADSATETGMLAEQLDPHTGEHLSVSPLTWSHATYVETIQLYLEKLQ